MLEKIEKFVASVCVILMAVLVFANVVARKVFDDSLVFSDEMSTYLFVLMSFMGAAIAARRNAHLGLSIITDRVKPRTRTVINMTTYAIAAVFCLLIIIFGVGGMTFSIGSFRLGGIGLAAVTGVLLNLILPGKKKAFRQESVSAR